MDRLDRVIAGLRYTADDYDDWTLREVLAMTALVDNCVCNIGCQACPVHPGNLFTLDQRFDFERRWDAAYKAAAERTTDPYVKTWPLNSCWECNCQKEKHKKDGPCTQCGCDGYEEAPREKA